MPDLDYLVEYFGIERINVVNSQEAIDELFDLVVKYILTPGNADKVMNMQYILFYYIM